MITKITCYTDGSCQYNPHGAMGFGYVIELPNSEIIKFSGDEDEKHGNSNNVAEYKALILLLERLIELNLTTEEILINTDCKLIHNQFMNRGRSRRGFYLPFTFDAARLVKRFRNLKISWIPREENQEADYLSSIYYKGAA
jgi:ribonuclease HI